MNRATQKKEIYAASSALHQRERRIVLSLLSLSAALVAVYIYCVSFSILMVVMRSDVDKRIAELGSDIGELEATLLSHEGNVGRDALSRYGLAEPEETFYITRTPASLVVSAHDES